LQAEVLIAQGCLGFSLSLVVRGEDLGLPDWEWVRRREEKNERVIGIFEKFLIHYSLEYLHLPLP
jgi:hypothetical protein